MSFVNETAVKAVRKPGLCDVCSRMVEAGQPAVRWAGITDGQFDTSLYHPECRAAEIALNKLHGTDRWGDDWMSLSDTDWEDWRWLVEEHPVVAERKGITLAQVEETEREREETHRAWMEIDRKRAEAAKAALTTNAQAGGEEGE